jgi:hypothetical protein
VGFEIVLTGAVCNWTKQQCPNQSRVAEDAVVVALSSFAGGASMSEACEQGRSFVTNWDKHLAPIGARDSVQISLTPDPR